MHDVALGLIWLEGDEADVNRARAWSDELARVYVIDARARGEKFSSLPDARLHYAPLREKASLGVALNRALALAFEEGMTWLWLVDTTCDMAPESLLAWSQKASKSIGLYQSDSALSFAKLWRRTPIGLLVAVAAARSLGGWDTELPAQLIFQDFHARLRAAGGSIEAGPAFQPTQAAHGFDFYGAWRSLWIQMQKQRTRKT